MIGEEPIESLFPEICGIGNDYQSGSKQPHSKGCRHFKSRTLNLI
jgi:hypothetical protein